MSTALLVLRLVTGVLFIGHGLQKLVPPKYSPPLLHAFGLQATADGFDGLGMRPALPAALLAGSALGPGSHSLDNAFEIGTWAGIDWSMNTAGRARIAVAIGAVCGLLPVIAAAMTKPVKTDQHAPAHARG